MSNSKRFLLKMGLGGVILFSALLISAVAQAQITDEAYRYETFNVSGPVSLEVQTSGGFIKVHGGESDEVRVEMFVRMNGRYLEAGQADLDDYEIEIYREGNTIKAISKRESGLNWNWRGNNQSISFVVYVPAETRTRLRTSGGSLSVDNMSGTQELKTSGGSITAENIEGRILLDTSGGSINVRNNIGNVEAETSGGHITVNGVDGDIDLDTSGGGIDINDITGNIKAETSGGSIHATVRQPKDYIDLDTSGGSITITVPGNLGYSVDLDGSRVNADLKNFEGKYEKDEVKGDINGGGIRIKAETSGGSVTLRYL